MIGFAGPRVIKETTHQDLPEGFQTAEFLEEHGLIDAIVHRKKMRAQISQGRMLSADPKEDVRDSYAQGLLTLEPELARLIDRRTSIARVRIELLRQAAALESRAKAIAWLEDADQMKVASKALEEALSEALAFAGRIDALIGKSTKLAID